MSAGGQEQKEMATMKLSEPYFHQLGNEKKYEMRPLKDSQGAFKKQASWKKGQLVRVTPNDGESGEPYVVEITERHVFSTFRDALTMDGDMAFKMFMPSVSSLDEAVEAYQNIAGGEYRMAEKMGGVVAWRMKRV